MSEPLGGAAMSNDAEKDAPQFECQACGKRTTDDGADALLGWFHDEDGELSFCADCGPGVTASAETAEGSSEHGVWDKDQQRYEDGCKHDAPSHAEGSSDE